MGFRDPGAPRHRREEREKKQFLDSKSSRSHRRHGHAAYLVPEDNEVWGLRASTMMRQRAILCTRDDPPPPASCSRPARKGETTNGGCNHLLIEDKPAFSIILRSASWSVGHDGCPPESITRVHDLFFHQH